MIRNLKALGLALVAVFALSAMAASAAHATNPGKITSLKPTYPLFLDATTTEPEIFTAFGSDVTCKHANYTSTEIKAATEEVFITPEYKECHSIVLGTTFTATVTHNGCEYRFYDATTEGSPPVNYTLKTDIVCPVGKVIEVHLYSSHANHTAGVSLCTLTIKGQTGLLGVTADVDTTAGDITLTGTVEKIHVEQHRNSFLCPPGTTESAGTYHLNTKGITVTGTDGAKNPNPFHIG